MLLLFLLPASSMACLSSFLSRFEGGISDDRLDASPSPSPVSPFGWGAGEGDGARERFRGMRGRRSSDSISTLHYKE